MKTILIFIGFKLVEIVGGVIGLFLLGLPTHYFFKYCDSRLLPDSGLKQIVYHFIICPWMSVAVCALLALIFIGIYCLCKANWKKAKQLGEKKDQP